jgi:hypothetical protein
MKKIFLQLLLIVSSVAVAQPKKSFQLIRYSVPENWIANEMDNVKQYIFSDSVHNKYCMITIYPAASAKPIPEQDFQDEWQTRVLSFSSSHGNPKAEKANAKGGFDFVQGGNDVIMKNGGGQLYVLLMVLRIGNQRQSISFASASEKMMEEYIPQLQNFMISLEKNTEAITSDSNRGLTVPKNNSSMANSSTIKSNNGTFYYGIEAATQGFNYGNSKRYLYLNPDGTFRWGFTQEGYFNYSSADDKIKSPSFTGTYKIIAGKIQLNFYSSQKMEFRIDANHNLQSSYQLMKFPSLNGYSFEGTYIKPDILPDLWPDGRQPKARFHKNGRFEDEGLVSLGMIVDVSLSPDEYSKQSANNRRPGNGTYRIMDNSLLLNYDDGRNMQMLIYIFDKDVKKSSPDLIGLGGISFSLAK